jgi:hypothetical protein
MQITTTTKSIAALLTQAGAAHHLYEQTALKGVYDRDWANWYADYAIEHGLNRLLGYEISIEQFSQFLTQSYADYQRDRSSQLPTTERSTATVGACI